MAAHAHRLRARDLMFWGLAPAALVAAPATQYARTACWAEVLHRAFPDLDGLIWTSNRCDPESAFFLFGDRVGQRDLDVVATRTGHDSGFVAEIYAACRRAGITLTV